MLHVFMFASSLIQFSEEISIEELLRNFLNKHNIMLLFHSDVFLIPYVKLFFQENASLYDKVVLV